ncbi:MAG: acyl carrier protein [Lachnospiraceae bacterium]|nr:acyl carrier protein [Lachnospiraceae bacterium]MDY5742930.1 acyl carrier protein [Lachnospiraceae bacterium]
MEFEKVQEIIADVLSIDPEEITLDSSFVDDLGADSLDIYEIIVALEGELDVEIDSDAAEKIVTVGDAVEQIKKLM